MNDYFTNQKSPTLATVYNASISSSTSVTLASGVTYIEVSAIGAGIFMKWGAVASSTTFDEFIQSGLSRTYIVPSGQTTVQFIQESATAKLVVIEK